MTDQQRAQLKSELIQLEDSVHAVITRVFRVAELSLNVWLETPSSETSARIVTTPTLRNEELMTVGELANYLRVKEATIYTWAKDGRIPCLRPNGELRFRRSAIDEWMTPNNDKPEAAREKGNGVIKSPRSFLRPQKRSNPNGRL